MYETSKVSRTFGINIFLEHERIIKMPYVVVDFEALSELFLLDTLSNQQLRAWSMNLDEVVQSNHYLFN